MFEDNEFCRRQELVKSILIWQRSLYQVIQGGISPEWVGVDLTMPQLKIMFLLNAHTRLRMGELSVVLGRNLSSTTGVVEKLVETGFVSRESNPDDRRVVFATITERGKKLCDSLLKIGSEENSAVLQRLSFNELKIVYSGMELYLKAAMMQASEKLSQDCANTFDESVRLEKARPNPD